MKRILSNKPFIVVLVISCSIIAGLVYLAPQILFAKVDAGVRHRVKQCGDALLRETIKDVKVVDLGKVLPFVCRPQISLRVLELRFTNNDEFIVVGQTTSFTGRWFAYNPITKQFQRP